MRYCKLCGKELQGKQIYYCFSCKKRKQVEWSMNYRKRKVPSTEIGVGSGNSSKNKNRELGIGTYAKIKKSKCELCGSNKYLVVHHKDFNRYNNIETNLQTLCRSCHTKTHLENKTIIRNSKGQFTRAK